MPDRYGAVTGQDFLGLANVVRGITKDRQVQTDARQQSEADAGYKLGYSGGELPKEQSAYTQEGFGKGLQSFSQDKKTQFNNRVTDRKSALYEAQKAAGLRESASGDGSEPPTLTMGAINKMGEMEAAGETPTDQQNAQRLASLGTDAMVDVYAHRGMVQETLAASRTKEALYAMEAKTADRKYKEIKALSNSIREAAAAGDTRLANRIAARAGNLSYLQDRFSDDGDKVIAKYYMKGEKAGEQKYTALEIADAIDGISDKDYIRASNASVVAAAQEPTQEKHFKDKSGQTITAVLTPSLRSRPASWNFFTPDGKQLAPNKEGQYLTRIQDYKKWGLKKFSPPTYAEQTSRSKVTNKKEQDRLSNIRKDKELGLKMQSKGGGADEYTTPDAKLAIDGKIASYFEGVLPMGETPTGKQDMQKRAELFGGVLVEKNGKFAIKRDGGIYDKYNNKIAGAVQKKPDPAGSAEPEGTTTAVGKTTLAIQAGLANKKASGLQKKTKSSPRSKITGDPGEGLIDTESFKKMAKAVYKAGVKANDYTEAAVKLYAKVPKATLNLIVKAAKAMAESQSKAKKETFGQ